MLPVSIEAEATASDSQDISATSIPQNQAQVKLIKLIFIASSLTEELGMNNLHESLL